MSERIFFEGDRDFLNAPGLHSEATVAWGLSVSRYSDHAPHCEGSFRLRDCNEEIALSLEWHNKKWFDNSQEKLDSLIRHAQRCKRAMRKAREAFLKANGGKDK